jgi:hypothetical protein
MKDLILGQLRHLATVLGALLVSNGYMSDGDVQTVVGGIVVVGSMAWSAAQKKGWLPVVAVMLLPLSLGACGTNWMGAAAPAILCVMDQAGQIKHIADTDDPDSVKATQALVAAGGTLVTSSACRAALTALAAPPPAALAAPPPAAPPPAALAAPPPAG